LAGTSHWLQRLIVLIVREKGEMGTKVRVWDLPTRVFHWLLMLCVLGSFGTAQLGGSAMAWHLRCGYAILALLMFRLVWGFVGGRWSRFSRFIYSPQVTVRYLKGQGRPEQAVGHTPLGALSVLTLLGTLLTQTLTGLTSNDDISFAGPLVGMVSDAWVNNSTFYHANVGKLALLGLVLLHLGAIGYHHFYKRQKLTQAMFSGDKTLEVATCESKDTASTRLLALGIFLTCAALVLSVASLGI
jgi:cytochrome b